MVNPHSDKCNEFNREITERNAEYARKWPNYCKTCGGHGGFITRATREEPGSQDGCGDCVEYGNCPRCGGKLPCEDGDWWTGEDCKLCNWAYEGKENGGIYGGDCLCDYNEIMEEIL